MFDDIDECIAVHEGGSALTKRLAAEGTTHQATLSGNLISKLTAFHSNPQGYNRRALMNLIDDVAKEAPDAACRNANIDPKLAETENMREQLTKVANRVVTKLDEQLKK